MKTRLLKNIYSCQNKDYKGIYDKIIMSVNDPANLRRYEAFYIRKCKLTLNFREECGEFADLLFKTLFTWSGGPRSSVVSFFCFHALGDTKQKKLTPLDRGPPLHVNRVLVFYFRDNS